MRVRLHAATEDAERARVTARQLACRKTARGRGSQRRDFGAVHERNGRSGRMIEQRDEALYRGAALRRVGRVQADELGAEDERLQGGSGHHEEQTGLVSERHDRTRWDRNASRRGRGHRDAHRVDAFGHRQQLAHASGIEHHEVQAWPPQS
jgi:hypothetical protein